MSPLTVKAKDAEITRFNTFGFKTLNTNKSETQSLHSSKRKVSTYFISSKRYIKRSIFYRCLFGGVILESNFWISIIPWRLLCERLIEF